jgi:hypothetical protein
VRLSPAAREEFDALLKRTDNTSRGQARQLARYMEKFCTRQPHGLIQEHYRYEGKYPDGRGGNIQVWVFKPDGWRLYGAVTNIEGKKCFVGVHVDPVKKRNKVDQALLRSVALMISEIDEWR